MPELAGLWIFLAALMGCILYGWLNAGAGVPDWKTIVLTGIVTGAAYAGANQVTNNGITFYVILAAFVSGMGVPALVQYRRVALKKPKTK